MTHDNILRISQPLPKTRTLGDYAAPVSCPCCDGYGVQLELVWSGGQPEQEREVPCYGCDGRGEVVVLVCGRCGEQEYASPDARGDDFRICSCCGHEAPQLLWLPMDAGLGRKQTQG